MKLAVLCLLTTLSMRAQEQAHGVLVTFSLQPIESFKAQFQATLPGVAIYSAMACNLGSGPVTVNGGEIYQSAFSRGLINLSQQLNRPTIAATRRRSKFFILGRMFSWLGFGGTAYTAVKGDKISPEWRLVTPIFTGVVTMINQAYETRVADAADLTLLNPEEVIQLGPRGNMSCKERLFLGNYRKDPISPVLLTNGPA